MIGAEMDALSQEKRMIAATLAAAVIQNNAAYNKPHDAGSAVDVYKRVLAQMQARAWAMPAV